MYTDLRLKVTENDGKSGDTMVFLMIMCLAKIF